tara:strand:- start:1273 stop:1494 length:222 start_codon:yes stop_codon:yes gene_type:complete
MMIGLGITRVMVGVTGVIKNATKNPMVHTEIPTPRKMMVENGRKKCALIVTEQATKHLSLHSINNFTTRNTIR